MKKVSWRESLIFGTCCFVSACATPTHVITGDVRPPIAPDQVVIYSQPPIYFKTIATLDASASSAFGTGGQKSIDKVISRLKIEAAKLGANGIILEGFSDRQTGSIGSGVGSASASGNTAVGVGVGGSLGIYKKTGHGEAIYVPPLPPPGSSAPPPAAN
jgi:hypothetical protein